MKLLKNNTNEKLMNVIEYYLINEGTLNREQAHILKRCGEILIRRADLIIGCEDLLDSLNKTNKK